MFVRFSYSVTRKQRKNRAKNYVDDCLDFCSDSRPVKNKTFCFFFFCIIDDVTLLQASKEKEKDWWENFL